MKKRLLPLFLAGVLSVSGFAGCGTASKEPLFRAGRRDEHSPSAEGKILQKTFGSQPGGRSLDWLQPRQSL